MERDISQEILKVVEEGKPFTLNVKEGLFLEYLLNTAIRSGRSPKDFLKEFFMKGFGIWEADAEGLAHSLTNFFITSDGKEWKIDNTAMASYHEFIGVNLALISMLLGSYRGVSLDDLDKENIKNNQYVGQVPVLVGEFGAGKTGWLTYTTSPFYVLFNTLGRIELQTGLSPSIYDDSTIPTEGARSKRLLPGMYDTPNLKAQKKIEAGGGIFIFDEILSHQNPLTIMAISNLITAYDKPYERFLIGTANDPVKRKDVFDNITAGYISSLSTRCAFINFNVLYVNKFFNKWQSINSYSTEVSLLLTLPIETLRRFGFTVKEGEVRFDEELFLSENGLTKEQIEKNAPLKALIRFSDLRDRNEIIRNNDAFLESLASHGFIYEAFVDYYILMHKLIGVNEDKNEVKKDFPYLTSIIGGLEELHKEYLRMLVNKIKKRNRAVKESYNQKSYSLPGFYNMLIKTAFTSRDIKSLATGWGILLKLAGGVESYTKPYTDYALKFISACNLGDYVGNRLYNAYKGFLFMLNKERLLSIEQIDEIAKHLSDPDVRVGLYNILKDSTLAKHSAYILLNNLSLECFNEHRTKLLQDIVKNIKENCSEAAKKFLVPAIGFINKQDSQTLLQTLQVYKEALKGVKEAIEARKKELEDVEHGSITKGVKKLESEWKKLYEQIKSLETEFQKTDKTVLCNKLISVALNTAKLSLYTTPGFSEELGKVVRDVRAVVRRRTEDIEKTIKLLARASLYEAYASAVGEKHRAFNVLSDTTEEIKQTTVMEDLIQKLWAGYSLPKETSISPDVKDTILTKLIIAECMSNTENTEIVRYVLNRPIQNYTKETKLFNKYASALDYVIKASDVKLRDPNKKDNTSKIGIYHLPLSSFVDMSYSDTREYMRELDSKYNELEGVLKVVVPEVVLHDIAFRIQSAIEKIAKTYEELRKVSDKEKAKEITEQAIKEVDAIYERTIQERMIQEKTVKPEKGRKVEIELEM